MDLSNGVEVLKWSSNNDDYKELPAVSSDTWKQGAFLYFDGTTVKPYVPADTTVGSSLQNSIFAIAAAGKVAGEIKASVCLTADVLIAGNTPLLGAQAVILYNATTGKYSAKEGAAYNTSYEPDITLTGDFLTFGAVALEADGRITMHVDGWTRFKALN